jgi:hypothetical protein
MKKRSRIEIAIIAIFMIIFGWQAIATGVIPAYKGKQSNPVISFHFEEPFVPLLGGLLIAGGLYILYRFAVTIKKK